MSASKITYTNKRDGDLFSHTEVNSIKVVVNSHADDIDALATAQERTAAAVEEAVDDVAALTSSETVITKTVQSVTGILPGPLYIWSEPVTSLLVDKAAGRSGRQNEYKLQFTVSGDAFTLTGTLVNGVRWIEEPDWEDGYTYQVSIMNGLAITAGWEAVQP